MLNLSRCKEMTRGEIGRWRWYICRNCGVRFRRFLLRELPEKARLCGECLEKPELRLQFNHAFEERDENIKKRNSHTKEE